MYHDQSKCKNSFYMTYKELSLIFKNKHCLASFVAINHLHSVDVFLQTIPSSKFL